MGDGARMTDRQLELARHALGLRNGKKVSYRNFFCAGREHQDWPDWYAMWIAGFAHHRIHVPHFGGDDIFHLTRKGAEAALLPGESLDREDFPALADASARARRG